MAVGSVDVSYHIRDSERVYKPRREPKKSMISLIATCLKKLQHAIEKSFLHPSVTLPYALSPQPQPPTTQTHQPARSRCTTYLEPESQTSPIHPHHLLHHAAVRLPSTPMTSPNPSQHLATSPKLAHPSPRLLPCPPQTLCTSPIPPPHPRSASVALVSLAEPYSSRSVRICTAGLRTRVRAAE